jgi:hypothetical protein
MMGIIIAFALLWLGMSGLVAIPCTWMPLTRRQTIAIALAFPPLWLGGLILVLYRPWTAWILLALLVADVAWLARRIHRRRRRAQLEVGA